MKQSPQIPVLTKLSRRDLIAGTMLASCGALAAFRRAHGLPIAAEAASGSRISMLNDRDDVGVQSRSAVHDGLGSIDIKFFRFDGATAPSVMLIYSIPVGASEGVHTHRPGDTVMGSFDEFYYILEGSGVMTIDGNEHEVEAGDHVFTPNTVPHGIANPDGPGTLRVFLTAIER